MKRILTLMILVLPFIGLSNERFHSLEGIWIGDHHQKEIVIKEKRRSIKVKGLGRRNKWVRFDQVRRGRKYRDCDGNVLKLTDRGELIYKNQRRGRLISFVRHYHAYNRGWDRGYGYYDRNRGDFNSRDYPRYDHNRRDYNRGDYNRKGNDGRSSRNFNNIEGTWFADIIKKDVFIENTNSGIRAKVGRKGKWTTYQRSRYNERKFEDSRGNSLELNSDGTILWRGGKGYKDVILQRSN